LIPADADYARCGGAALAAAAAASTPSNHGLPWPVNTICARSAQRVEECDRCLPWRAACERGLSPVDRAASAGADEYQHLKGKTPTDVVDVRRRADVRLADGVSLVCARRPTDAFRPDRDGRAPSDGRTRQCS